MTGRHEQNRKNQEPSTPPNSGIPDTPRSGSNGKARPPAAHEAIRWAELALREGNAVRAVEHYTAALGTLKPLFDPLLEPPGESKRSVPAPSSLQRWLLAHRGDAWAKVGGWKEAADDFGVATRGDTAESPVTAWALAHHGEMLRLKARDDEETRADGELFLETVLGAIERFDEAIKRQAVEASRAREAQPAADGQTSESSAPPSTYEWAYAHRAATGVLCWLYYVADRADDHSDPPADSAIPSGLIAQYTGKAGRQTRDGFEKRVDEDFRTARKSGTEDPWSDQFEALWLVLTSTPDHNRLDRADALAGRALLSGAPSFPLEAGMVLAALFASGEGQDAGSTPWMETALRRANDLLLKDPTHPMGHAALAAIYRWSPPPQPDLEFDARKRAYSRAHERSVEVLRMNRDLLDELIEAVTSDAEEDPTSVVRRPDGKSALAARPTESLGGARKEGSRRGFETRFIGKRLRSVAGHGGSNR